MPAWLGIESAYSRRLRSSLEVARIFQRYNLVPVPVAGEAGRLAGLIAIDGIAAVIQEEAGAEVKALCGMSGQEELSDPAVLSGAFERAVTGVVGY